MNTVSIAQARSYLQGHGARVRMTGGGLVDDSQPQMEAKVADGTWLYVAQIAEGEVSEDHVLMWVDQNVHHKASSHDTDTPAYARRQRRVR